MHPVIVGNFLPAEYSLARLVKLLFVPVPNILYALRCLLFGIAHIPRKAYPRFRLRRLRHPPVPIKNGTAEIFQHEPYPLRLSLNGV